MENKTKYCKFCAETIDFDCVVCPKCGKQIESLKGDDTPIIINNSSSSSSAASSSASNPRNRRLPWYLTWTWILILGFLSGGIYFVVGLIMRVNWLSNN